MTALPGSDGNLKGPNQIKGDIEQSSGRSYLAYPSWARAMRGLHTSLNTSMTRGRTTRKQNE